MWSPGLERVLLSEKIGIPSDFLPRFNMFPVVHPRRNCSMETGMRRCTDNIPRCKQWWQELWSWWNDIDIYWHTLAFLKHHWAQLLKWPHFQTSKGWTQSIRGQETALSYLLGNSQHQNLNIVCAVYTSGISLALWLASISLQECIQAILSRRWSAAPTEFAKLTKRGQYQRTHLHGLHFLACQGGLP